MGSCNDQSAEVVREMGKMLATLDPNAMLEIIEELGLSWTPTHGDCAEGSGSEQITLANFEQFATSYVVGLATKEDCHLAYFKCLVTANENLAKCLKKAGDDVEKKRKCLDDHAEAMKKCIKAFEDCKKKKSEDG